MEKRFASILGVNEDDIIADVITPMWHRNVGRQGKNLDRMIMNEIANQGATPTTASLEQVWLAHKRVYSRIGNRHWADAIYAKYFRGAGVKY